MDEEIKQYQSELEEVLEAEKEPTANENQEFGKIRFLELIKSFKRPLCVECESPKLITESWAKPIGPNVYNLWYRVVCKECGHISIQDQREVDHNTEKTRMAVLMKKDPPKKHFRSNKKLWQDEKIDVEDLIR